jgi:hypothetical protein
MYQNGRKNMNALRIVGALSLSTALFTFTFPIFAVTISGSQVNLYVGYESEVFGAPGQTELILQDEAGLATIYGGVEYPEYWVASHDIDEVSPGLGSIEFRTDNSPLASIAQFSDWDYFNGFVYEFPGLNILSASLSSTNQPDVINDTRVVLLGPTFIGLDMSGLEWGFSDPEPIIMSVDFQTEVPIPAAAWFFGFGLIGLIGVARRGANA